MENRSDDKEKREKLIDNVGERTEAIFGQVRERAEELGEQAAEAAREIKEDLADAAERAGDFAAEVAEKVREKAAEAEEKKDELVEKAEDFVQEVAEKVHDKIAEAEEKKDELVEKAEDFAAEVTETVHDKAAEAKDFVTDAAHKAGDLLGEAADKAMDVADQALEALDRAADKADEALAGAAAKTEEAFVAAAAAAGATVGQLKGKAAETGKKIKKGIKGFMDSFDRVADRKVIDLHGVSIYHTRGFSGGGHPKKRRDDELVLSGVDLEVRPGEMVYLIGKVGSGKSTLLKTLYAEIPLYEGRGEIVGYDLRRLRRKDVPYLRRKIGVVFQDYQLLTDRNVFHNLHYVMSATGWKDEGEKRRRIEEVLGLVGLVNKEYKMPFELSGGEQQRLAIARALINRPQVILADEPTGNLDPAAAEGIMLLFKDIVHTGCSIVMSTHNISNIQLYPGRTIRFANGKTEEINIHSILGI